MDTFDALWRHWAAVLTTYRQDGSPVTTPVNVAVVSNRAYIRTAEETGRGLTTNKVFNAQELQMINRGNVERIIPKYKGT